MTTETEQKYFATSEQQINELLRMIGRTLIWEDANPLINFIKQNFQEIKLTKNENKNDNQANSNQPSEKE